MVLKARSDGFNLLSKPGTVSMPSEKLSGLEKQQNKTGKKKGEQEVRTTEGGSADIKAQIEEFALYF